jgi:hypothetical protein
MHPKIRTFAIMAVGLVTAALVSIPPVNAREPIPTTGKRNFGGATSVTYHRTGSPGAWWSGAVVDAVEHNFRDANDNNSKVPTITYSSSGDGEVSYHTAATSPCGSQSTVWLQCAKNPSNNENWTVYVRNLSTSGPAGWTWWDQSEECGSNGSTCWYLRRALIHELGHAMLAFPDLCKDPQPCWSESDTVMNQDDPEVGTTGSTSYTYRRCDEAAAQMAWDVASLSGPYANCYDGIPDAGVSGLATTLTITSGTSYYQCNGMSQAVSGYLRIRDYPSYGPLGANPLAGRTVWFDRGSTSRYASDVASTSSGNNWSKSFGGTNVTYTYVAHFDDVSGDGLADSGRPTFTITWGPSC